MNETKRNDIEMNETERNETEMNETEMNETEMNETKIKGAVPITKDDALYGQFSILYVLDTYREKNLEKIPDARKNPAYTHKDEEWSGIVFIEIKKCKDAETGEPYAIYTIINKEDYEKIKVWQWSNANGYFVNKKGGYWKYLHRMACKGFTEEEAKNGKIVHHKGSKFDNRSEMLEVTTRLEHNQKTTYDGILIIGIKKGSTKTKFLEIIR